MVPSILPAVPAAPPTPGAALPGEGGFPQLTLALAEVPVGLQEVIVRRRPEPPVQPRGPQQVRTGEIFVATNDCLAFYPEDDRLSHIQGTVGSVFEVVDDTLVLRDGQMLFAPGIKDLKVKTDTASLTLKPRMLALVQTGHGAPTRVTLLDKGGEEGLIVQAGPSLFVVMGALDELLVAQGQIRPEDLSPPDGVTRDYFPSPLEKDGITVMQAHLEQQEIWERNPLLACRLEPVEKHRSFKRRTAPEKLVESLELLMALNSASKPKTAFELVASVWKERGRTLQHTPRPFFINDATRPGRYFRRDGHDWKLVAFVPDGSLPGMRLTIGASLAELAPDRYFLYDGALLLHPKADVIIYTGNGDVLVEEGSVALVSAAADITRVLNLSDRRPHGIHLVMNDQEARLAPGWEASFTRGGKLDARQLVLSERLGRRDMRILPIGENQYAVTNEFSVVDALLRHPLLRELRRSEDPEEKQTLGEIQKTAAALAVGRDRQRGPYSPMTDVEQWP